MKLNIIYEKRENEEDTGIGVMQGTVTEGNVRRLFRGMPLCRGRRRSVGLMALCRKNRSDRQSGNLMRDFLRWIDDWFEKELPGILSHFSFEIVMCYWRRGLWDFLDTGQEEFPFDLAMFLFYEGACLYCGSGEIHIYEYLFSRQRYKRWYTVSERRELPGELGRIGEQGVFFQVRKISEHCLFILCPDQIHPGDPEKYQRKNKWQKFISEQCRGASAVLLAECRPDKKREGIG